MRISLLTLFFFNALLHNSSAQVQIVSANLPQAGDALVTRDAVLLVDYDLSYAGENATWTFGDDVLQAGTNLTTTNCIDIATTPFAYQFLFNNPFDPEHNSDFAQGVDQISAGQFTLENAYAYFQNNNTRYAQTGLGATINGIPVPAQANPVDVIYELPIDFGDQSTSLSIQEFSIPTLGYWRTEQNRANTVDGWGSITLYGQTFDALRVVTTIDATDSIYVDFLSTGFSIPRPQTISYKWLSPLHNVPIVEITTTQGLVTGVQTVDLLSGVAEQGTLNWSVYPSPAENELRISGEVQPSAPYSVYNGAGQLIASGTLNNRTIDVSNCASGLYLLQVNSHGKSQCMRWIKQ